MGYTSSTPFLGLPQWADSDYMQNEDWNAAWTTTEKAIRSMTYLMDTYSYTWTMDESEETGETTITVTMGSDCPRTATMTAVISENEQGETVAEVTTTIDGEIVNGTHTIGDEGGEGGPDNG